MNAHPRGKSDPFAGLRPADRRALRKLLAEQLEPRCLFAALEGAALNLAVIPLTAADGQVEFQQAFVVEYRLTTTSEKPLSQIAIWDDDGTPHWVDDRQPGFVGGDANENGKLDAGEEWTFQLVRNARRSLNSFHVRAVGEYYEFDGPELLVHRLTDEETATYFGVDPAVELKTTINGQPPATSDGPLLPQGSTAVFGYQVHNRGNVPMSHVEVRDDNGTPENSEDDPVLIFDEGDENENGLLDVDEVWRYYVVRPVASGQHSSLASVVADHVSELYGDAESRQLTDEAIVSYVGVSPEIDLSKLVNDRASAALPTGQGFLYAYRIENPGGLPLRNVVVWDDNGTPENFYDDFQPEFLGGDANENGLLDPGEVWSYAAGDVALSGEHASQARVTADFVYFAGPELQIYRVTDFAEAEYVGFDLGLSLTRTAILGSMPDVAGAALPELRLAGVPVTYLYFLKNEGTASISGVSLFDDNGTPLFGDDFAPVLIAGDNGDGVLDPGEVWVFAASGLAPRDVYTSLARATGQVFLDEVPFQLSAAAEHRSFGAQYSIDIKAAIAEAEGQNVFRAGRNVTFVYTVTNTGNRALSQILVVSDNGTPGNTQDDFLPQYIGGDDGNGVLDPGEVWIFSAVAPVAGRLYVSGVGVTALGDSVAPGPVFDDDALRIQGIFIQPPFEPFVATFPAPVIIPGATFGPLAGTGDGALSPPAPTIIPFYGGQMRSEGGELGQFASDRHLVRYRGNPLEVVKDRDDNILRALAFTIIPEIDVLSLTDAVLDLKKELSLAELPTGLPHPVPPQPPAIERPVLWWPYGLALIAATGSALASWLVPQGWRNNLNPMAWFSTRLR